MNLTEHPVSDYLDGGVTYYRQGADQPRACWHVTGNSHDQWFYYRDLAEKYIAANT